tara:strand:- start:59 stop:856 length:798 start_codon:yes stop_codon:yes gene_type:complete
MNLESYRKQWIRYHRRYERTAYSILRRAVVKTVKSIDLSDANEDNYERLVKQGVLSSDAILNAYIELYNTIGLLHGKRVLKDIRIEEKGLFEDDFFRQIAKFINNFGGQRIKGVSDTLADFIISEIARGQSEGVGVSQIVTNILKKRSFYRWQLLRIARTETTAAANYASDSASSSTGLVLEKVWVSAQDSRTRVVPEDSFDHLHMNGKRVDDGKMFEVATKRGGVELMQFPGDPRGSAGDVINCRCAMVKVPKRDANGRVIRKF